MTALLRKLATRRFVAALVAILLLLPLIWVFGPLLKLGGQYPLEPAGRRLVLCAVVLLAGLAALVIAARRAGKREEMVVEAASAPDPAQQMVAEEEAVLREKLAAALQALRRTGGRAGALYEMPWYVLVGPPGAGKTTALQRSGLEFPLAEGKIAGVGGTRNCDWWLSERAVLLDTAGRYTTQDSDAAADREGWRRFLDLLRRARPRQPLNGIIVAFGIDLISRLDAAGREQHARAIRRRIGELQQRLAQRLPVYLMISKADLLPGFVETFDDLDRDGRRQVWGVTFPPRTTPEGEGQHFAAEFALLLRRLQERLLPRLQAERGLAQRAAIAGFPAQFASLQEPLSAFIQQAFGGSRLDPAPFLRGVYFTSGTQEGSPIDRLTGAMARSFGLDSARVAASSGAQGRSYFLGRLLTDVIFNEAQLAADPGATRRRRWLGAGAWGLAALVVAGGALWGASAWQREAARADRFRAATAEAETRAASLPPDPVASADLMPVLPYLDATRTLSAASGGAGAGLPGLDQSAELAAGARTAYRHALERVMLPRLLLRLEQQLNANLQRPEFLYGGLRVYLMLGRMGPLDRGFVHDWMRADWAQLYPGAVAAPQRAALLAHLDALLQDDFPAYPIDGQLVDTARRAASRLPMATRVMARLRDTAADVPAWTPAQAMGPAGQSLFIRTSGKPLTDGVPGLYTIDGLYHAVLPRLPQAVRDAASEGWVLGPAEAPGAQDPARLEADLLALYARDYGDAWQALLDDLRLVPVTSLQQQAAVLNVLGAPDSPLRDLIRGMARQLSPGTPPETDKPSAQATKVTEAQGAAPNPAAPVGQAVQARFAPLLAAAGAPLDADLRALNALYVQVASLAASPPGTAPPPIPAGMLDPGQEVLADAARSPEPLARILRSAALSAQAARSGGARAAIAAGAAQQIAPLCRGIETRFPFRRDGADMPIDDFTRLFAPGGVLDQFFVQNIRPYADTTTSPWRPVAMAGGQVAVSSADLLAFQHAQAIRDAFFPGPAGLRFELLPLGLDAPAKSATLEAEGMKTDLQAAAGRPILLGWPARGNVTLSFDPPSGAGPLALDGAWSSLRLAMGPDSVLQPDGRATDRFRLTLRQGEHWASFLLRAGGSANPFALAELHQFRCPVLAP